MEVQQQLKVLVENSKWSDFFLLFSQSIDDMELSNAISHLKSRYTGLKKQRDFDTIGYEDYNISINKIRKSALDLVNLAIVEQAFIQVTTRNNHQDSIISANNENDNFDVRRLTYADKKEIIEVLIESQTFQDEDMVDGLIKDLPSEIRVRISKSKRPLVMVKNVLNTVLAYSGGWEIFFSVFIDYDGNSNAVKRISELLKKY